MWGTGVRKTKQRRFGNGCCCVQGWELPAGSLCIVLWFIGKRGVQMLCWCQQCLCAAGEAMGVFPALRLLALELSINHTHAR